MDNLGNNLKVSQISCLSEECGVVLWLTGAFFVTVEYGESPEGQRPGSGTVICYLSEPPMAERRNGNQI